MVSLHYVTTHLFAAVCSNDSDPGSPSGIGKQREEFVTGHIATEGQQQSLDPAAVAGNRGERVIGDGGAGAQVQLGQRAA